MDRTTYNDLQQRVRQVIRDKWLSWKGLDEIVSEYTNSGKIVARELNVKEYAWEDCSGFIYRDGDKFFIGVSESDSFVRKRFTLGHELGHFFMHGDRLSDQGMIVDRKDWLVGFFSISNQESKSSIVSAFGRTPAKTLAEQEANEFAAELLMPKDEVERLVKLQKEAYWRVDLDELAMKFGVSWTSMVYRIQNLDLIGCL